MPIDINLVLSAFLALMKLVEKDFDEDLLKEWKEDEQKLLTALGDCDAATVNSIIAKWRHRLQTPRA